MLYSKKYFQILWLVIKKCPTGNANKQVTSCWLSVKFRSSAGSVIFLCCHGHNKLYFPLNLIVWSIYLLSPPTHTHTCYKSFLNNNQADHKTGKNLSMIDGIWFRQNICEYSPEYTFLMLWEIFLASFYQNNSLFYL